MTSGTVLAILNQLAPGSVVQVWFDSSGFLPTYFQFFNGTSAAFSGGALDGGLTYLNASQILAIRVG